MQAEDSSCVNHVGPRPACSDVLGWHPSRLSTSRLPAEAALCRAGTPSASPAPSSASLGTAYSGPASRCSSPNPSLWESGSAAHSPANSVMGEPRWSSRLSLPAAEWGGRSPVSLPQGQWLPGKNSFPGACLLTSACHPMTGPVAACIRFDTCKAVRRHLRRPGTALHLCTQTSCCIVGCQQHVCLQGFFTHTGRLLHLLVSPSCSRCTTHGGSSTRGSPHSFSMRHSHSHTWGPWPGDPTLRLQRRCSNTC